MTQVLDEFEQLLEESFAKSNSVADIVEGTVIKKESEGYLVSVKGAKMEAFLSNKELSSDIEELEIGEVREFYVLKEENNEDSMLLSLKRIAFAQAWAQLNDAKIQGDTILAKVVSTANISFKLENGSSYSFNNTNNLIKPSSDYYYQYCKEFYIFLNLQNRALM